MEMLLEHVLVLVEEEKIQEVTVREREDINAGRDRGKGFQKCCFYQFSLEESLLNVCPS